MQRNVKRNSTNYIRASVAGMTMNINVGGFTGGPERCFRKRAINSIEMKRQKNKSTDARARSAHRNHVRQRRGASECTFAQVALPG